MRARHKERRKEEKRAYYTAWKEEQETQRAKRREEKLEGARRRGIATAKRQAIPISKRISYRGKGMAKGFSGMQKGLGKAAPFVQGSQSYIDEVIFGYPNKTKRKKSKEWWM